VDKLPDPNQEFFFQLKQYAQSHWLLLVWIILTLLIVSLCQASAVFLVGPLLKLASSSSAIVNLSDVLPNKLSRFSSFDMELSKQQLLFWLPVVIVLVGATRSLANFFFENLQARFSLGLAAEIRETLFAGVLTRSLRTIKDRSVGAWMTMIVNDVMVLQTRVSEIAISMIRDLCLIVFALLALFFVDSRLGIVALVLLPLIAVSMGTAGRRISQYAQGWQKELAKMGAYILDLRGRFEFMYSQNAQSFESSRFQKFNDAYYKNIRKSLLLRSLFAPLVEWLGFLIFAASIMLVFSPLGREIFVGATLIEFFVAIGLMVRPLRSVGEQLSRVQEVKGSLSECLATLARIRCDDARAIATEGSDILIGPVPLPIEIELLKVRMAKDELIQIEKLSLKPGSLIAIIGQSGSGKSSILKSLANLYETESWKADVSQQRFGACTALVSQDVFLFSASIRENLIYGLPRDVGDEELLATLALFSLRRFVEELPQGLDSLLFAINSNLSGGQMQRMSLARAWLRDAPIMLLDEATSALDALTEDQILRELTSMIRASDHCLIAVTHRYDCLGMFDEVIVMNAGKVIARGTPTEIANEAKISALLNDHERGQQ
jgi:subfamily B ATP-binding cassette protein MsbA